MTRLYSLFSLFPLLACVMQGHPIPDIPIITSFKQDGSVIIETIFAWPGMGRMGFEAILARDYPIIVSLNFVAAVLTLAGTFVSDLLYLWVDPRIKL